QRTEPRVDPAPGNGDGVGEADPLGLRPPADELDDTAGLEIDGRVRDHRSTSTARPSDPMDGAPAAPGAHDPARTSSSAERKLSSIGHGPMLTRTASPRPGRAGKARTRTPRSRSAPASQRADMHDPLAHDPPAHDPLARDSTAPTAPAAHVGEKSRKFAADGEPRRPRRSSSARSRSRCSTVRATTSRTQSRSSARAARAVASAAAVTLYGPRLFSISRISGAGPIAYPILNPASPHALDSVRSTTARP